MRRHPSERLGAYHDALVHYAGGHLRNPLRVPGLTCEVCTTPSDGNRFCYPCASHRRTSGVADIVCALTYAISGAQSGYLMRQYKGSFRIP